MEMLAVVCQKLTTCKLHAERFRPAQNQCCQICAASTINHSCFACFCLHIYTYLRSFQPNTNKMGWISTLKLCTGWIYASFIDASHILLLLLDHILILYDQLITFLKLHHCPDLFIFLPWSRCHFNKEWRVRVVLEKDTKQFEETKHISTQKSVFNQKLITH